MTPASPVVDGTDGHRDHSPVVEGCLHVFAAPSPNSLRHRIFQGLANLDPRRAQQRWAKCSRPSLSFGILMALPSPQPQGQQQATAPPAQATPEQVTPGFRRLQSGRQGIKQSLGQR